MDINNMCLYGMAGPHSVTGELTGAWVISGISALGYDLYRPLNISVSGDNHQDPAEWRWKPREDNMQAVLDWAAKLIERCTPYRVTGWTETEWAETPAFWPKLTELRHTVTLTSTAGETVVLPYGIDRDAAEAAIGMLDQPDAVIHAAGAHIPVRGVFYAEHQVQELPVAVCAVCGALTADFEHFLEAGMLSAIKRCQDRDACEQRTATAGAGDNSGGGSSPVCQAAYYGGRCPGEEIQADGYCPAHTKVPDGRIVYGHQCALGCPAPSYRPCIGSLFGARMLANSAAAGDPAAGSSVTTHDPLPVAERHGDTGGPS